MASFPQDEANSYLDLNSWKGYAALIFSWQVTASACFYAIYAVTPFVRDKFGVSATFVGLMLTTMTFGYTLFLVPTGSVIDRYGERLLLFVGLVGLGFAAVMVTLAPTYLVLLIVVFVLGGFYAPAMPGTNKAVFAVIPSGRRNTSMGIKQVGVTVGSGISAVLVPWFGATRFGWEAAFVLAALAALLVGIIFRLAYPLSGSSEDGKQFSIRLHFREPAYAMLTAGGLFLGAGLFSTVGYTILYVVESVQTTTVFAGIVLAAAQISGSAGRLVSGGLVDRLSMPELVSSVRILIAQATISAMIFVVVAVIDTPVMALISFTLLGFFVLGYTGIYYSCIGALVSQDEIGNATAGGQIALNIGAMISPPAFGYIVDVGGYSYAWLGLAVVSLVATLLFIGAERNIRR